MAMERGVEYCSRDFDIAGYMEWLLRTVRWEQLYPRSSEIAFLMNGIPFKYVNPNDENRGIDGNDLRSSWCESRGMSYSGPYDECSVLEMMIALAIRMDDEILYDPSLGTRQDTWFWLMMHNLGLEEVVRGYSVHDEFALGFVATVLDDLVVRDYQQSGAGGLFPRENPSEDQRKLEIWDQMQGYLSEHPEIM